VYQRELELRYSSKGPQAFNQTPVRQLMNYHLEKYPESRVTERMVHFKSFCEEFGNRPICQIGKSELMAWFKKTKERDDLSDRTLSTIKSNLNSFFNFLVDEEIILDSPLFKIQFDRKPPMRRPRVVLSIDEIHRIIADLKVFSPAVLYPLVFVAAYTGARRGEVMKLRRSDVDLQGQLIHFRQTKNGEDRSIRIGKALFEFLSDHLSSHDSPFAFPGKCGDVIPRHIIGRHLRRFRKTFPIGKHWGLHSLRHSFAFNFLKKGGNMYQLQAILGHKSIDVTVDTYGQIGAQDVENACPYES
jgi:integrase/recombinase XerD